MISLSPREAQLLAHCQHKSLLSIAELAKQSKLQQHIVRHTLERLTERGVIVGRAPFLNLTPLGYTDYTFFLSLYAKRENRMERLVQELIGASGVAWVASTGGGFQLAVSILATHAEETINFFYELSKKCGVSILDKSLSVRTRFQAFGRKYLSAKIKPEILHYGMLEDTREIDSEDRAILSVASGMHFEPMSTLANKIGMSPSTFLRRMAVLKEKKILQSFIYRLNCQAFGMEQFRLLIFTQGLDQGFTNELRKFAKEHPQITHLFECLGDWDFEIVTEVQNPENTNEIMQQLFDLFQNRIRNVRVLQIYRHLKYVGYPFSRGKKA